MDNKVLIKKIDNNIVHLEGKSNYHLNDLVKLPNGAKVLILVANRNSAKGVIINKSETHATAGEEVKIQKVKVQVKYSREQFGRIINAVGDCFDGHEKLETFELLELEASAVPLLGRELVNQPMETGITAIDLLVPIGKGQRQLIIGDRQTGKTSIAVDTMIKQAKQGIKCVYVTIGQRTSKTISVRRELREAGVLDSVIIINSPSSEAMGMQYLAPYAGMSIANKLAQDNEDVLIIFDDLSKHADVYRGISLLLERPPAREAYPGDVFYIHSRLLERAGNYSQKYGGGSVTALPIIETQANDLTAYIPTNTISITDGQIYTSSELFAAGQLPAIDISASVSRVGSTAQRKIIKDLSKGLKITLSRYSEVKKLSQISGNISEENEEILKVGKFIKRLMEQDKDSPFPTAALAIIARLMKTKNDKWFLASAEDLFFLKKFLIFFFKNHPTGIEIEESINANKIKEAKVINETIKTLVPYFNSLAKKFRTLPRFGINYDDVFVKKFLMEVKYE